MTAKDKKNEQSASEDEVLQSDQRVAEEGLDEAAVHEDGSECVVDTETALLLAQEEIQTLKDKLLRSQAEMDNLRKRTAREIADAHKFGIEKFTTALLDVVDNLERALDVEEGNEAVVREGVKLTLQSWQELLKRFHVERIDAVGEQFDPHKHEALTEVPSDQPKGTVVTQHVAGYLLHGRLIRAAKVLVSSGSAE